MSRFIAIGDVHGCKDELEALLNQLDLTKKDTVIFLGDLVNRGPDSSGVLCVARSLPNARCVMGNHERRLLKYRQKGILSILKNNDLDTIKQLCKADWEYIESMQKYIYEPSVDTVFVHGGFLPDKPWHEQPRKVITRIQVVNDEGKPKKRSECPEGVPWADLWKGPPFVVCGHTPALEVVEYPQAICIDTACVLGGKLTAYILPDKTIVQVPAKKRYWYG